MALPILYELLNSQPDIFAESALREMLVSMEKGVYVKPNRLTLGEWLLEWFDSYVILPTTPRTQGSYDSIMRRHLVPNLGVISPCAAPKKIVTILAIASMLPKSLVMFFIASIVNFSNFI